MTYTDEHTFHIPVMGLAYTIDSPVKVARFGISSVISIIEDRLIEMMRKHYYPQAGETYFPIATHEPDYRAKRITDYLNLVNKLVQQQVARLKSEAFDRGSEIVKYFEMLPQDSRLKKLYLQMTHCTDAEEQCRQQELLREKIIPGRIDVNILTKADRENHDKNGVLIPDGSDAVSALRGYIRSDLSHSAIVFSAGMNPRLYSYLETTDQFFPDADFQFKKHVIVKVSDYRSALIQGKFLAKKGIWVSEFRIESGLNCGGHAFATDGYLMGPILQEFKDKRTELFNALFEIYEPVIRKKLNTTFKSRPELHVTVQGGIGTFEEDRFLRKHFEVSSTGWGTPFLLVPEATTVDDHTLELLCAAREKDVVLSHNSPLGVRFYYLKGTTADIEKQDRIKKNKPGSPCTEKHLGFNTEFTEESICTASHKYQKLKLAQLKSLGLPEKEYREQETAVLAKECLCVGLSNSAALNYNEVFLKNLKAVNVCPGPNIANFSRVVSLQTMTDHIYGRDDILSNRQRPHMFIAELTLYMNYLKEQLLKENMAEADTKRRSHYQNFIANMNAGIEYYQELQKSGEISDPAFGTALSEAAMELQTIKLIYFLEEGMADRV